MTDTPALNDDLVSRLHALDDGVSRPVSMLEREVCGIAASALEAQSKEIEALRSALEPFVSEAEYYDLDAIPAPIHIDLGCSESREAEYTVADLRRARTALKGA